MLRPPIRRTCEYQSLKKHRGRLFKTSAALSLGLALCLGLSACASGEVDKPATSSDSESPAGDASPGLDGKYQYVEEMCDLVDWSPITDISDFRDEVNRRYPTPGAVPIEAGCDGYLQGNEWDGLSMSVTLFESTDDAATAYSANVADATPGMSSYREPVQGKWDQMLLYYTYVPDPVDLALEMYLLDSNMYISATVSLGGAAVQDITDLHAVSISAVMNMAVQLQEALAE